MRKFSSFFLDCAGFRTQKAIVFNLSFIILLLAIIPTDTLANTPVKCVFKHLILPTIFQGDCPETGVFAGCNCPACGLTRGMSRLLHGDMDGALSFNPLTIPLFIIMISLIIINTIRIFYGQEEDKS